MATHTSTRRGILGAIAGVPVAAAFGTIPVPAMGNRHAEWLAERNRINDHINASPLMSEDEADAWVDRMVPLERNILSVPAATIDEARAKLRYAAHQKHEGLCIPHNEAAELFAELAKWFAAH